MFAVAAPVHVCLHHDDEVIVEKRLALAGLHQLEQVRDVVVVFVSRGDIHHADRIPLVENLFDLLLELVHIDRWHAGDGAIVTSRNNTILIA